MPAHLKSFMRNSDAYKKKRMPFLALKKNGLLQETCKAQRAFSKVLNSTY
jgi:hypothetical protein